MRNLWPIAAVVVLFVLTAIALLVPDDPGAGFSNGYSTSQRIGGSNDTSASSRSEQELRRARNDLDEADAEVARLRREVSDLQREVSNLEDQLASCRRDLIVAQ